jgi:hypothetical protein
MGDAIAESVQDAHTAVEGRPPLHCRSARNGSEGVVEDRDPQRLLIPNGLEVAPEPEAQLCDQHRVAASEAVGGALVGTRRRSPTVLARPTSDGEPNVADRTTTNQPVGPVAGNGAR